MDDETRDLVNELFKKGKGYEIVGTTVGRKGKGEPNASALGVTWDGEAFSMKVFKGSDTFENLRGLRRLGINLVTLDEVHLMARAALVGWNTQDSEFGEEDYVFNRGFPFLRDSAVHIDCMVEDWTENYGQDDLGPYHIGSVRAIPERSRVLKVGVEPMMRGDSPIIEAMIYVTRWQVTEGETKDYLRKKVEVYLEKAKVGSNEAVLKAVRIVERFLADNE